MLLGQFIFKVVRENKSVEASSSKEFCSLKRPLTSYVAAVELVVAAADHAFLSEYNDNAILSTDGYPPHSSRGGRRKKKKKKSKSRERASGRGQGHAPIDRKSFVEAVPLI